MQTPNDPTREDLFDVGTVSTLLQLLKLPDGTVKVLVEGGFRARILDFDDAGRLHGGRRAVARRTAAPAAADALVRSLMSQFEQYVQLSKKVPEEVLSSLSSIDEPGRLVDTIAAQMTLKVDDRQNILETVDIEPRIERILALMGAEIDLFQVEKRIRGRVKKADGEESARVLPQRTDEGDPEGTGRPRRSAERNRRPEAAGRSMRACRRKLGTRR